MVVWGEMETAPLTYDFSFSNYEVYLNNTLIFASLFLLTLITFSVLYITYVSWKDNKRTKNRIIVVVFILVLDFKFFN